MGWLLIILIVVHGLIHFIGVGKAFDLGAFPQLTEPISQHLGILWLVAGLTHLTTAIFYLRAPQIWWGIAFLAVILSQIVIITAWSDAWVGTVANLIILAAAIVGAAAHGPTSFEAKYRQEVSQRAEELPELGLIEPQDLAALPEPLRCYLEQAGVVGQPRVHHFKARWRGRIRGGPDEPWMEFSAEQVNFVDEPARFFLMKAKRGGLPVDVLHSFARQEASMRVKLLSLFPMVNLSGPKMTRAETVTILNDMSIMAPAALLQPAIEWTAINERRALAIYSPGEYAVEAEFITNDECELVDFVSDDRLAATPDGKDFLPQRWSTPLYDYGEQGPYRLPTRGEARWHPPEGEFAYMEAELLSVEVNSPVP